MEINRLKSFFFKMVISCTLTSCLGSNKLNNNSTNGCFCDIAYFTNGSYPLSLNSDCCYLNKEKSSVINLPIIDSVCYSVDKQTNVNFSLWLDSNNYVRNVLITDSIFVSNSGVIIGDDYKTVMKKLNVSYDQIFYDGISTYAFDKDSLRVCFDSHLYREGESKVSHFMKTNLWNYHYPIEEQSSGSK